MKLYIYFLIIAACILFVNNLNGQEADRTDNPSFVFVEEVGSLDELFAKFKGSVIYVDFWASWCSPCLDELKPHAKLDSFITANNIVRLYIALEKQEADTSLQLKSIEKWKANVQKYNLTGYNYYIQLKTTFFKGVTEKIMKGKLNLPRFAIVDKNGIIVQCNAKPPSDGDGVIKQLLLVLKSSQ